jgi:uncharacterized protein with HEPN domain
MIGSAFGTSFEAIERIETYSSKGRSALYEDELIQTWIIHHLLIIGEACRALSTGFRAANPDDIWTQAAGLRNVIVHEYFGVDHEIIWGVVERDLPNLKERILRLLAA